MANNIPQSVQRIIDNLIAAIRNSEEPESVTNEMVGSVLEYLNEGYKDVKNDRAAISLEADYRRAADTEIRGLIANLYTKSETDQKIAEGLAELVGEAPETLDTLEELAQALQNNDSVTAAINQAIATKADAADVYNKTEIDGKESAINTAIATKANAADVYTKEQVDNAVDSKVGVDDFNQRIYGRLSNADVARMRQRGVVIIHGYGAQYMGNDTADAVYLVPPVPGRTIKAYVYVGDDNWYGYTYGELNSGDVANDGYYIDRYSSILYRVSNGQVERLSVQNQALMLDDWLSNDLDSLSQRLETISETIEPSMVTEIEWSALVSKRNNSQLTPGMWYRITDYLTTTVQEDTQSANHPFDLLVMATSPSTLSEEAKAIKSARDTANYFAKANMNAWRIWYCLDNDTNKFAWADSASGKGVIYRMIDEHNNDCPYDFKNILYKRYYKSSAFLNGYYEWSESRAEDINNYKYAYTFNEHFVLTSIAKDISLGSNTRDNIIKSHYNILKLWLPNIIFLGGCHNNTIDGGLNYTFQAAFNNKVKGWCRDLIIYQSYNVEFEYGCQENMICNSHCVTLDYGVCGSVITNASDIKLGAGCCENSIGEVNSGSFVENVEIGPNCQYNTISRGCSQIKMGENCTNNTIKRYVRYLTMEEQCNHNEIPANCWYVTLDKNVGNLTLRSTSSYAPQNVHIYGGIDTYVESEGGYGYGYGYGAGGGDIYTVEVNALAPFTEVKPIGTETHYL